MAYATSSGGPSNALPNNDAEEHAQYCLQIIQSIADEVTNFNLDIVRTANIRLTYPDRVLSNLSLVAAFCRELDLAVRRGSGLPPGNGPETPIIVEDDVDGDLDRRTTVGTIGTTASRESIPRSDSSGYELGRRTTGGTTASQDRYGSIPRSDTSVFERPVYVQAAYAGPHQPPMRSATLESTTSAVSTVQSEASASSHAQTTSSPFVEPTPSASTSSFLDSVHVGSEVICYREHIAGPEDSMPINIKVMDRVEILIKMEDGSAIGRNTTTDAVGQFPLSICIPPDDVVREWPDSQPVNGEGERSIDVPTSEGEQPQPQPHFEGRRESLAHLDVGPLAGGETYAGPGESYDTSGAPYSNNYQIASPPIHVSDEHPPLEQPIPTPPYPGYPTTSTPTNDMYNTDPSSTHTPSPAPSSPDNRDRTASLSVPGMPSPGTPMERRTSLIASRRLSANVPGGIALPGLAQQANTIAHGGGVVTSPTATGYEAYRRPSYVEDPSTGQSSFSPSSQYLPRSPTASSLRSPHSPNLPARSPQLPPRSDTLYKGDFGTPLPEPAVSTPNTPTTPEASAVPGIPDRNLASIIDAVVAFQSQDAVAYRKYLDRFRAAVAHGSSGGDNADGGSVISFNGDDTGGVARAGTTYGWSGGGVTNSPSPSPSPKSGYPFGLAGGGGGGSLDRAMTTGGFILPQRTASAGVLYPTAETPSDAAAWGPTQTAPGGSEWLGPRSEKDVLRLRDEGGGGGGEVGGGSVVGGGEVAAPQHQQQRNERLTAKMIARRKASQQIVMEMYETEKNFRDEMKVLMEKFMTPFSTSDLIPKPDHERIFKSIPGLYNLSSKLCTLLQKAVDADSLSSSPSNLPGRSGAAEVVNAFLVETEYEEWGTYMSYMAGYLSAKQALGRLEGGKEGRKVRELVERCESAKRIGRYHLLLQRLKENTEPTDPLHNSLETAEQYMKQIGSILESVQKHEEEYTKIFEVHRNLIGCPPDIISAKRRLLAEFEVEVLGRDDLGGGGVVGGGKGKGREGSSGSLLGGLTGGGGSSRDLLGGLRGEHKGDGGGGVGGGTHKMRMYVFNDCLLLAEKRGHIVSGSGGRVAVGPVMVGGVGVVKLSSSQNDENDDRLWFVRRLWLRDLEV
ncbi:hypothetical protein HDV00_009592, partial [Rhizophlyctis rosea]